MALRRFCCGVVLVGGWWVASVGPGFSAKDAALTSSGLPVPRYVSLKSDHVNVRAGPDRSAFCSVRVICASSRLFNTASFGPSLSGFASS